MSIYDYKEWFVLHNPGPWVCHFCGWEIARMGTALGSGGCVHHLNGDHEDNDIRNLVAAHISCHTRYHHTRKRAHRPVPPRLQWTQPGLDV